MAHTAVGKVTLANGLVLFLSCVFTGQFADAAKIALRADIAMIVSLPVNNQRDFVKTAANKLVEYFEIGEDKVRLALVTATVGSLQDETDERLVQPVTANQAEFQMKVDEWTRRNYTYGRSTFYGPAIYTVHTKVFLNSGDRGKAVLLFLMYQPSFPVEKEAAANVSELLRKTGCKMYIITTEHERMLANNCTGDPEKVFIVKEEFDDSGVANLTDYIIARITKDLNGAAGPIPLHWLSCCVIAGAVFWGESLFS